MLYNEIMKIGINASFARKSNTGIGQVTLNFLKKLSEESKEAEIFLYLEQDLTGGFGLPKNWKKRIFLPFWKRDDLIRKIWWEKYMLPQKAIEDGCDIFLSLYQSATILPDSIKHLMIVHDIIPKIFPEYLNNLRKKYYWSLTEKAIRKVDKIIAVSHRTEKDLVQKLEIDPEKITVSHIDVDRIYKKIVSQASSWRIMEKYGLHPGYIYSGGGLEVRKNVEGTIRAYNYLREKNKKLHFVEKFPELVISGKLMPELAPLVTDAQKIVKKLNLTKFVKMLDFVPQEDLPALYKNASMFIYPSFYEGFGLPILEAMSQGTPVITSKTSSLPEVGRDAVLYCNPGDIQDIAMVMKNLLTNKYLREKLSERGKERSLYFTWGKLIEKFLNVTNERKF